MRIAQIAPLHEAVPPKLYGGTERMVSYLTEELVALGHQVTLFASGDSVTSARLHPAWPHSLRLDPDIRDVIAPHMLMLEEVRRHAEDFDVLHFHLDYWPFSIFSRQQVQRLALPQARFVATVPHGIPDRMPALRPPITPAYLAFLGRIAPEKGPDRAIRIARACGIPLRIAAKVDKADQFYFDTTIRPMLDSPGVEMIGEISEREKPAFLSGAKGLLMPIEWPEPFGLVMIEAMSWGTPVIAFNRGSVPEVIEEGVTGFIVEDEAAAIAAVGRLDQLDRRVVRARFEQKFTARRMAEDYLEAYARLAADERPLMRPPLRVIAGGMRSS
jgi:glycosyltransferase involved in cell wall biosynthesis